MFDDKLVREAQGIPMGPLCLVLFLRGQLFCGGEGVGGGGQFALELPVVELLEPAFEGGAGRCA